MKEFLIKLGLSPKEAAVYQSLMDLGSSRVSEIAQKARLNRTTAYDVLESLRTMGLVSSVGETKRRTYAAERPDALVSYLQKQSRDFQDKADQVKVILPELRASFNEKGNRPRVRFYQGKEGMEAVYEDTLSAHEPIMAYASVRDMHEALPHYFPEYYQRRARKGIKIRAILPATPEAMERSEKDKTEARESMLVPVEHFDFSPEINIYDDKVVIISLAEEFGVIIESKEIAEAQKKVFELAWEGAMQYKGKIQNKYV